MMKLYPCQHLLLPSTQLLYSLCTAGLKNLKKVWILKGLYRIDTYEPYNHPAHTCTCSPNSCWYKFVHWQNPYVWSCTGFTMYYVHWKWQTFQGFPGVVTYSAFSAQQYYVFFNKLSTGDTHVINCLSCMKYMFLVFIKYTGALEPANIIICKWRTLLLLCSHSDLYQLLQVVVIHLKVEREF